MKVKQIFASCLCLLALNLPAQAQQKNENEKSQKPTPADSIYDKYKQPLKAVSHGSVNVEGKKIAYQAVAGTLVLKDKDEKPTISMSYTAYFKDDAEDRAERPLTFVYNGGPGSATVWLHMGAWGPRRVFLNDTAATRAPYKTVNNDYSLLDASDLVFIDAPGTGFGKIITKDMGGTGKKEDFYGIDQDAKAFAHFITNFLSEFNRWNSPKYLFGESYGTFRSAVVANVLQNEDQVELNGIILLSQLLTYGNMTEGAGENPGNDQSYKLILPSYTATAWYHQKLPEQPEKLEPLLKEVENFALTDYALALNKGSEIDSTTFNNIARKLHQYTGLPVNYIKKANLRVSGPQFEQTLLGKDNRITGRLDSRFTGAAVDPLNEYAEYDPMTSYIGSAFTSTFNNYVRQQLNFGDGMKYKIFGKVRPWKFQREEGFGIFPNVMNDLAQVMIHNPNLKVMLNMGYFDLGTPYFEGIYEMHHLPMPASLQKNIEYQKYYSGHMVYLHPDSLKLLHDKVAEFINSTY